MPFSVADVRDQRDALKKILGLIEKGSYDPTVRSAALKIASECESRDDLCELQAIYDAVKHGTDKVPSLRHGFKYVADPRAVDFYMGARRILTECMAGACGGDCDDHTVLVGSLCAALGFKVGARAWGPNPNRDVYAHVYCVVAVPKRGPWPKGYSGHGMDTTVKAAYGPGWEPPKKRALTMWLEDEEG